LLIVEGNLAYKVLTIDNLPKSPAAYEKLGPIIGKSILVIQDGTEWHKLRKMFNPAFSQAHLETLVPHMVEETLVFVGKLEKAARQGATTLMLQDLTVTSFRWEANL
jgi:cytochrome P450